MHSKSNQLMLKALLAGVVLNFILPFTYSNRDLALKEIFSVGNPLLILPYAFLAFIAFYTITQKDLDNKGRIVLDKPKDIPKTILKSVLEIIFGIIFIFLVPLLGGAILFWSSISIKLVVLICISYIAVLAFLGKKYYWKT